MSSHYHFVCNDCGSDYPSEPFRYLCPLCESENLPDQPPKGVLKMGYPYGEILQNIPAKARFEELKKNHFIDLLPIAKIESYGCLRIGETPVYQIHELEGNKLNFNLFVKDDSQNPTFSFKDRASALVSAYAREHGIEKIVAASTGNAGSSLAGICASQHQKAIIIVPKNVPKAKLLQIIMYGATPVLVDGNYDVAFELSLEVTRKFGWFNRNTAFNPLTIEGKKTVAFEIYDHFRENMPNLIFVPVGDGVIISGVYKGFEDLLKLQIINKMPTIISVQSQKSDNLNRNLNMEKFEIIPATTVADSISVDIPRNFRMAEKYITEYQGESICVSDDEIKEASSILARNSGVFAEPAASASMAGMLKYLKLNKLKEGKNVLVLSTGSGLKDLNTPLSGIVLPSPVQPSVDALKSL
jgi:threonine synthase